MKRIITITACTFLLIHGGAFAHEGEHQQGPHGDKIQMERLHKIMPLYAQVQAKINEALTTGDATMITEETGKILATIPYLKKSKPHKNIKQIAAFRKIAAAFAGDVKKTTTLAKSGDFGGAKDAFQFARMRCDECHAKFRD